jgi:hypothetical protein
MGEEKSIHYEKLRKHLKKITGLGYYNAGKTELICRCPFPGCEVDQKKNYSYGRLYLSTEYPFFNCFRCNTNGSIFKLLDYLDLDYKEYTSLESNDIKKFVKSVNYKNVIRDININDEKNNDNKYLNKVEYLKTRLGADYNIRTIPNLVFNIKEFITDNKIILNDREKGFLNYYEDNCIGFIGSRHKVLVLRSIKSDELISYHKINIDDSAGFKDFYGMSTGPILPADINKIVLCEGVFDFLVGYNHLSKHNNFENVCHWAAVFGSQYRLSIFSIMDFLCLTYVDVIILSDKDKDITYYDKIKSLPCVRNVDVFYNVQGHDFGELPIEIGRVTQ